MYMGGLIPILHREPGGGILNRSWFQDFPLKRGNSNPRGVPTYYSGKFSGTMHENKENWFEVRERPEFYHV